MPLPPTPHVYIWIEANDSIGLGHLRRQLCITETLVQARAKVTMVTSSQRVLRESRTVPHANFYVSLPRSIPLFLRDIAQDKAHMILSDIPQACADQALFAQLMAYCPVVQFDVRGEDVAADYVIIPGLHVPPETAQLPSNVRLLTGAAYCVLPRNFQVRRRYQPEARHPYLVITMGGGYQASLVNAIAQEARQWEWGRHATLMVPTTQRQHYATLNHNSPIQWKIWDTAWLFTARLAVVPLGQTLLETLYAWTPSLVWARSEQDQALLLNLDPYGVRTALTPHPWTTDPHTFSSAIQAAWEDHVWQERALTQAQSLNLPLDGAARITRACLALLTTRDHSHAEAHL